MKVKKKMKLLYVISFYFKKDKLRAIFEVEYMCGVVSFVHYIKTTVIINGLKRYNRFTTD